LRQIKVLEVGLLRILAWVLALRPGVGVVGGEPGRGRKTHARMRSPESGENGKPERPPPPSTRREGDV